MARQPLMVLPLVTRLGVLGVELPERVTATVLQLRRFTDLAPSRSLEGLVGLADEEVTDRLSRLAVAYTFQERGGTGVRALSDLAGAMANQLADEIAADSDAILDQLRPAFDVAAVGVWAAVEVGISPSTTDRDIVKSADLVEAASAWGALPAHVRTLESIAGARIMLTRATGVPPFSEEEAWDGFEKYEPFAGAMFHRDAPGFHPDNMADDEHAWQRWLRMSRTSPVELLTLAESQAAAGGGGSSKAPAVPAAVAAAVPDVRDLEGQNRVAPYALVAD